MDQKYRFGIIMGVLTATVCFVNTVFIFAEPGRPHVIWYIAISSIVGGLLGGLIGCWLVNWMIILKARRSKQ